MANQRDSILVAAIQARNDGRWLTRKQFWLLRSRGIDPLGPSDDEQSTRGTDGRDGATAPRVSPVGTIRLRRRNRMFREHMALLTSFVPLLA